MLEATMHWSYFYERYDSWPSDVAAERIKDLEDVGDASEVAEVADMLGEPAGDSLVRKAISLGTAFDFQDIPEFDGCVSEDTLTYMVDTAIKRGRPIDPSTIPELDGLVDDMCITRLVNYALDRKVPFTADQIVELDGLADEKSLSRAAAESSVRFSEDDLVELEGIISEDALQAAEMRTWPTKRGTRQRTADAPTRDRNGEPVVCPRCGSTDVRLLGGSWMSYDSPLVVDVLGTGNEAWISDYQCNHCGHFWQAW